MRKSISCLFMLWAGGGLLAQTSELSMYRAIYPDDKVIRLEHSRTINLEVAGDSIVASLEETTRNLILDDAGGWSGGGEVSYNYWMPLRELEAYTLVPNGKKYKKREVETFKDLKTWDGSIFAHDDMQRSWTFPSLVAGAITHQHVVKDIREPRFISPWYFGSFVPVVTSRYSIVCPDDMELTIRYFNMEASDATFSKTSSKGRTTYTWEQQRIPALSFESGAPSAPYIIPHVMAYVRSYNNSRGRQTLMDKVDDLHAWYATFIDSLDSSGDPELRAITDSLVQGKEEDVEKIKAIYYWVQNNIKYIAFEEGWGGFVPRQASEVCSNRYGDCKDMATMIYEMGKMAGLDIHLAWIGTRDIPYRYEEVPTPISDNHMIAAVQYNGEWTFLDATSEHLPFGYPSSFIQGKEALIHLGDGQFELAGVPVVEASRNTLREQFSIQLDPEKQLLKGVATEEVMGYRKMQIGGRIRNAKASTLLNDLNTFYTVGNNKFRLESFDYSNLNDKDQSLLVRYDFVVPDYAKSIGDEVYVSLQLSNYFEDEQVKADRKMPLEREYLSVFEKTVELLIPEGYDVSYMPEKSAYQNDDFSFRINYFREADKVRSETSIEINHLLLEPGQFENWNTMIETLSEAYRELVILKKIQTDE